jgi:Holliday junction resolvasome RuvABC ATP-dependent DNA helicase subunit
MSNLFHPTAYLKKNNEDKIFNSIYGRDDIKQIILIALRAEQPVHVLLTGEPGCGKIPDSHGLYLGIIIFVLTFVC